MSGNWDLPQGNMSANQNTNSPTPRTDAEEFLTGWQGNDERGEMKTPITDAAKREYDEAVEFNKALKPGGWKVARQLETKLQSALREVEELKAKLYKISGQEGKNKEEARSWLASENHGR